MKREKKRSDCFAYVQSLNKLMKYVINQYKFVKRKEYKKNLLFYCIIYIIVFAIVGNRLVSLELHMLSSDIKKEGINYDAFRLFLISKDSIKDIKDSLNQDSSLNKKLFLKNYNMIDYLTGTILSNDYNLVTNDIIRNRTMRKLLNSLKHEASYKELGIYYLTIIDEIECFPIPLNLDGSAAVTYKDTWNVKRSYGGNRRHEGTDLIPKVNITGMYEIRSMTNGYVEKLGWLEQGGYRIGIRGKNGGYYYYAHLDSYAPNLAIGDYIEAGSVIGYMGDTGYGVEGTRGKFIVHLHLGIYVEAPFGEMSINPYHILTYLEDLQ